MPQSYHVFTKYGDARDELDAVLGELGSGSHAAKGFHKVLFVTRANQTVVFLDGPTTPLAVALRAQPGWEEPEQGVRNA